MTPSEQRTALLFQEGALWMICAMLVQFQLRLLLFGGSLSQMGIDLLPPAVLLCHLLLRGKHWKQISINLKEE